MAEVSREVLENIQSRYLEALDKHVKSLLLTLNARFSAKEDKAYISTQLASMQEMMASELALIESKFIPRGQVPLTSKSKIPNKKEELLTKPLNTTSSSLDVVKKVKKTTTSKKTVSKKEEVKKTSKGKGKRPPTIPSEGVLKEMKRPELTSLLEALKLTAPEKATLLQIRKIISGKKDPLDMSKVKKALDKVK